MVITTLPPSLSLFSTLNDTTNTQSTTSLPQSHSFPFSNPPTHPSFDILLLPFFSIKATDLPLSPPLHCFPLTFFCTLTLYFIYPHVITMKIIISLVLAAASVIATTSSEPLSKRAGPGPHWDVSIFIPHIATSFSLLFPSSYFPFSVSHQFFPCPVDLLIPSNLRALLFLSFSEISCAQPHNPIAHFSNPDLYEYVSVAIDIVPACCGCAHPDNLIVCCRLSRFLSPFTFLIVGLFALSF